MVAKVISREDVFKACEALEAEGETPSTLKIREVLKAGSPNTIQRYLREYEAGSVEVEAKPTEPLQPIPQDVLDAGAKTIIGFYRTLEAQFKADADKAKSIAQQEAEAVRRTAEANVKDANEVAEALASENDYLKDELEKAKAELEQAKANLQKLANDVELREREIELMREQETKLRNDLQVRLDAIESKIISQK